MDIFDKKYEVNTNIQAIGILRDWTRSSLFYYYKSRKEIKMSNKFKETKVLEEDIQDKYFERLEKITKEYCKTLRLFFITQSIFVDLWILGYFIVSYLLKK